MDHGVVVNVSRLKIFVVSYLPRTQESQDICWIVPSPYKSTVVVCLSLIDWEIAWWLQACYIPAVTYYLVLHLILCLFRFSRVIAS